MWGFALSFLPNWQLSMMTVRVDVLGEMAALFETVLCPLCQCIVLRNVLACLLLLEQII